MKQLKKQAELFKTLVLLSIMSILLIMTGCQKKVPEAYIQLIDTSQTYIDDQSYDKALESVEAAIAIDSSYPEAYVQKGFIHVAKGEYNQAGEAFAYVAQHLNDFNDEEGKYAALLNLGNYDYMTGDIEQALAYFMDAKKIHAQDTTLLNAIGLIYISKEDYDTAKEYYNEVIDLDQNSYYAYGNLAIIYSRLEDYKTAIDQINTALSLNPSVPQFYMIKGDILTSTDNIGEAIQVYTECITRWSELADPYYKRGELYLNQKQYLEAVSDFSMALSAGLVEANLGMGYAYNGLEQYDDAINAFKAYQNSIDGVDLKVLYELGVAYYQKKAYESSIASIDQLLSLEPKDTEAMLLKAYNLERLEKYDEAYDLLESILAIDPGHEGAKKELAFIDEQNLR